MLTVMIYKLNSIMSDNNNYLFIAHLVTLIADNKEGDLAASKKKEQQLQSKLEETRRMYQDKDQQVSRLEGELQAEQIKTASLIDQFEQQHRELEMLQQKGKTRANVADSDVLY